MYISEIVDNLGRELFNTATYSYTVYGNVAVWIEGHKGISTFGKDSISFKLKSKTLTVLGEKLKIRQLTTDCALICGKIIGVSVDV